MTQKIDKDKLRYHDKRVLVCKEFTFDSAHNLYEYEGKCKHLHGHTYKVIFGISGYMDPIGMVIDFGTIKNMWKTYLEPVLDHKYLNESLPPMNTTAENMVYWIFEQMNHLLESSEAEKARGIRLEFVRLYETPTSYAEMRREWFYGE